MKWFKNVDFDFIWSWGGWCGEYELIPFKLSLTYDVFCRYLDIEFIVFNMGFWLGLELPTTKAQKNLEKIKKYFNDTKSD